MAGFLGTVSGQVRLDIRQAVAAYAKLRADNARLVYTLRGTGDSFIQSGRTMATVGAGLVYMFGKVVSEAAQFEKKMDFFAAVTDASEKQVAKLRDTVLDLSNTSIYTADQIADGVVELGKAGVSTRQIIKGIGRAMVNLAAAGDITLAESGQIISSTIAQFGLAAEDAIHVTDILAGTANASIADIADIGVSLKYVGGIAAATGLELDDVATAISILAKNGIRGSTAGTSLRQMIVSLGGATKPAMEALKELGIVTEDGSNKFYDQEGNIKPLSKVYQILQNALEGMGGAQKAAYLRTIFNNRALAAGAILTREGSKGFKDMYKEMSKTTAADVANERLDNLSGDIKILKSNINTYMIKAGTPFQKQLRSWVQNLTKLVQAFGKLNPETQEMITRMVGLSGAALIVMGVFNIIVGTILKFIASALKMKAGILFLTRVLGLYTPAVAGGAAATGLLVGPIGWVVLALVALGIAFVIAYKKSEKFRNWVKSVAGWVNDNLVKPVVKAAKAVIKWFQKIAKDPKKAWEDLKNWTGDLIDRLVGWFTSLPSKIGNALKNAAEPVGDFVKNVGDFFAQLPGKVLGLIGSFVSKVLSYFTFSNLGTVLGTVAAFMFRWFTTMPLKVLALLLKIPTFFFKVLGMLLPISGRVLGFLLGFMIRIFWNILKSVWNITSKLVTGLVKFFLSLPGRIWGAIQKLSELFRTGLRKLITVGIQNGPKIIESVLKFFRDLPGKVLKFLIQIGTQFIESVPGMLIAAGDFAQGAMDGFWGIIKNLPSLAWSALGNVISAFLDMIKAGFDAAKGFAGGLWEGFKDGIGMNSPSYIEKAMWQITGVLDEETKKMSKQVMTAQKISKKLAETQLVTNTNVRGAQRFDTLANTRRIQKQAAMDTASSALIRGSTPASGKSGGKKGDKVVNIGPINNPRRERASTSTGKALKTKAFEAGWSD